MAAEIVIVDPFLQLNPPHQMAVVKQQPSAVRRRGPGRAVATPWAIEKRTARRMPVAGSWQPHRVEAEQHVQLHPLPAAPPVSHIAAWSSRGRTPVPTLLA